MILTLDLHPSRLLIAALGGMHLAALFTIWLTDLPLIVQISLVCAVLASYGYHLARAGMRAGTSWCHLHLNGCEVTVQRSDGRMLNGGLMGAQVVSPYGVILGIRDVALGKAHYGLIMPDAVGLPAFRALCVLLRHP